MWSRLRGRGASVARAAAAPPVEGGGHPLDSLHNSRDGTPSSGETQLNPLLESTIDKAKKTKKTKTKKSAAAELRGTSAMGPRDIKVEGVVDTGTTGNNNRTTNVEYSGAVCLMQDNPLRVLKLAARGKVEEMEKLLYADPSRLKVVDGRGRGALHHAAAQGQLLAIDFILGVGTDIDIKDNDGDTALHLAVREGQVKVVQHLLTKGATSSMLNGKNMAAIHLAVDRDKTDVLEAMLSFPDVDPNEKGLNGDTPLHHAAWNDRDQAARILLEHKATMCAKCQIGLTPLHVAAMNSASRTMETLLQYAEKAGYKREDILKHVNQEKCTPLHAAIGGADLRMVMVCLEAGSQIDACQEDGGNSLHLAAAQGCVGILKAIFEKQPDAASLAVNVEDKAGMTPLHKAALYNKAEATTFLLDQGATTDVFSKEGLTPMLLAATKKAWRTTEVLIQRGADCSNRDPEDRNILHLIIRGGAKPSQFSLCLCNKRIKTLLDEQDKYGSTPLHYASKEGHVATIEALLTLGASLLAKNHNKQSALHFAARYGRINTCRHLMDNSGGTNIVNETDGQGQAAIHAAAANGHTRVVQHLLMRGAALYKDMHGNTPLHEAAKNGFTQTMTCILNFQTSLMDSQNKEGNTPMHLAAREGHANAVSLLLSTGAEIMKNEGGAHFLDEAIKNDQKDVCVAIISHDRWRDAMSSISSLYGCPMVGMIKYMPEVCVMVLDRCRRPCQGDKNDTFHHHYDYRYLQVPLSQIRQLMAQGEDIMPMFALNLMVRYNRVEALSHPVCLMFLKMKWNAYGMYVHLVNLLIYVLFLGCLTGFITTYDNTMPLAADPQNTTIPTFTQTTLNEHQYMQISGMQRFLVCIILAFCCLNGVKEVVQMFQQKEKYFTDWTNALEWVLYITTAVFVGPFLVGWSSGPQWQCAALSVFLAWFNLLLFLQRFDVFGLYVVMFLQILKTLIKVLFVFSIMIVAFGLSFYILLSMGSEGFGFRTPALSLMSTVMMMIGSVEYMDNWVVPISQGDSSLTAMKYIMLLIFIFLMPILLINLLIGLAVGDIESVKRDARLKRLAMQVQLHTDLEKKLPHRFLEYVDKEQTKVYPGDACTMGNVFQRLRKCVSKVQGDAAKVDEKAGRSTDVNLEHQTYLYQELHKQKQRMKQVSGDMQKQTDLLRLIIQKMEIHTEADECDEGESSAAQDGATLGGGTQKAIGWSSPALRQSLIKQAAIIQKWKGAKQDC